MFDVWEGYVRVDWGERSVVRFFLPEARTNCCNSAVNAGQYVLKRGVQGNEHDDDPVNHI